MTVTSDEPEMEFSSLSQAELWRFRAELGHFDFRAETELQPSWTEIFLTHFSPKFLLSEVLYHDFNQIHDNLPELCF